MPQYTVAALLTCHNRRTTTLNCLASLYASRLAEGIQLHVILVDDGSTDGTTLAVEGAFPQTTVIRGDGSLFWNRGMHLAFERALSFGYNYYLWLNDDTILLSDAIERLLHTEAKIRDQSQAGIIVGSTCDPQTKEHTYGGWARRERWRPLKFDLLAPGTAPTKCDAMNGNCVLVPAEVAATVGNLDWTFEHSMGDFDYALRASRMGFPIWIAPGFFGTCKRNLTGNDFLDPSLPLNKRLRCAMSRKNLPPRAWAVYARRHGGAFWFVYWAWPYIKIVLSTLLSRNHDHKWS